MSKGTLGEVVKRAIGDAAFRRQLQSDPGGALKGFDLTNEESSALRSGDAAKLSALGIDQRMSKMFSLGDGAVAASKSVSASDVSRAATVPDGGEPLVSEGLVSGSGRDANQALISNPAGGNTAIRDSHDATRGSASDASGAAFRTPILDPDNVGGAASSIRDAHDAVRISASDASGATVRSAVRDPDNTGGGSGSSIRDAHDAASPVGTDAGGAAYRSPLRDPDNAARSGADTGGSAGPSAPIEGSPEQTAAELRGAGASSGSAMRDSHDSISPLAGRESLAGTGGTEGTAFLTADQAGRDVVAADNAVGGNAALSGDAFLTADEMGRDVTEGGGNVASQYPDATAERSAIEASQQGDDIQASDPWAGAGNPEHQG